MKMHYKSWEKEELFDQCKNFVKKVPSFYLNATKYNKNKDIISYFKKIMELE